MNRRPEPIESLDRRGFLRHAGLGFGLLGLQSVLSADGVAGAARLLANPAGSQAPHFKPRAKSVIFLFMYGGVSHIDTFEHKPALRKYAGKEIKTLGVKGLQEARTKSGVILPPAFPMRQHGASGKWICDRLPHLARIVDRLTFVNGVHADSTNHGPALLQMNCGMTRVGYPSVGSWVTYGLGSPNQNMPGFVVMYDHRGGPINGPQNWGSGFLPGSHQATPVRATGSPILDLARPADVSAADQRAQLELLRALNGHHRRSRPAERDLDARIQSFELAYRMQSEAPELMDLTRVAKSTRRLYGIEAGNPAAHFGTQCLTARRLVERGVRFVQLYSGGSKDDKSWDAHGSITANHGLHYPEVDQPIAALILDLERRGMLDETLVVWATEFGRTPHREYHVGGPDGRDHHPFAMTLFFAGGGMRPGIEYGATDELGYYPADTSISVHDVHATILHQLGLDHERLTFTHQGREVRLTDVSGAPIVGILG